mmetsp:Transcript_13740/g.34529  ORF Transcript_13740/g.34529 Transcript_13740/m.34529 type:complete len:218 (-) Transcript_13740:77-730(-)
MKETSSDEDMLKIVRLKPDLKCFRRETPVAHRNQALPSRSQDSANFLKDFFRFVEVVNAYNTRYFVEGCVFERKLWVFVEIFRNKLCELRILAEFVFVHSQTGDPSTLEVFGVMGNPRTTNVEDVVSFLQSIRVILCQRRNSGIINVVTKTGRIVENGIFALIHARKIGGAVRPFIRKLGIFEYFFRHAAEQSDRQSIPRNFGGNRQECQSNRLVGC